MHVEELINKIEARRTMHLERKTVLQADIAREDLGIADCDEQLLKLGEIVSQYGSLRQNAATAVAAPGVAANEAYTRLETVMDILAKAAGPMTPREVHQAMLSRGRHDDYDAVHGTLSYLTNRKKKLMQPSRGQYELVQPVLTSADLDALLGQIKQGAA